MKAMDIKRPPEIREHLTSGGCFLKSYLSSLLGSG